MIRIHLLMAFLVPGMGLAAGPMVGIFGEGKGTEVRDLVARADGAVLGCAVLGEGSEIPKAGAVHYPFGNDGDGARGCVFELSSDLSELKWVTVFPGNTLDPERIDVSKAGVICVGGKNLGGMEKIDSAGQNWSKSKGALAALSSDGAKIVWVAPGGPNQDGVTGLSISGEDLVYFTAGSGVRAASNYLLRKNLKTGEGVDFEKTGWCVYLHTNQEPLKEEGQFLAYYEKAKGSKDGFDYDGEGGWEAVSFSLTGFRIGGQVLVLPDGDVVMSSCLQYDFRVKGEKKFPAFDLFLARYGADGTLRWSTNLYREGDSVHTPDQKPSDLAYDAKTDKVYVLAKQHGSNAYRFQGELVGDTGNLMISWLGKVEAKTGGLEAGWYFQNNRLGKFGANGIPASPPYPKLAGNQLNRVKVGTDGLIYLAGNAGAKMWTTADAWEAWPEEQGGGGNAALVVLEPDLKTVRYASCFFTEGGGGASANGLVVRPDGVVLGGRKGNNAAGDRFAKAPWSSGGADEGSGLVWGMALPK